MYQKTIVTPVNLQGVGLHSGKDSTIKILPGEENQGIVFKRVDLKFNNIVSADYENVSSAKLCTTLENEHGVKISTVEHLLAALYITGIDNAIIEINNEEVPIMDGSAKDFLSILKKTKIKNLTEKRKYLKITDSVELIDGLRKISIEPNKSFEVDFQLNYENKIIGQQRNLVNFQTNNLKDVVESRTFCLFEDIEEIKKIGLAKGGSLDNAIVVRDNKILNSDGLRNNKEFVNHKILDLAGDFLLSGYRILGSVKCMQGGHSLSNLFLRNIFKDQLNFTVIEQEKSVSSKNYFITPINKLAVNA